MCGRFVVSYTYDELIKFLENSYQIEDFHFEYEKRYNISPGQMVLSVIKSNDKYKVGYLEWGFLPPFSSDRKYQYKMINAKSETIEEKVSFKDSFLHKRCLILANGFYEWKKEGTQKIPYFIQMKDKHMFAFAGLWTMNEKVENKKLFTTTIITTEANDMMKEIHDRMPVILQLKDAIKWLDSKTTVEETRKLLQKYDSSLMMKYVVSDYVNKSTNEGIKCIEEHMDGQNTLF